MDEKATDEIRDLTAEEMEGATGGWGAVAAAVVRTLSYHHNQVQREIEIGPVEVQTLYKA
jgi:hypothetical protein